MFDDLVHKKLVQRKEYTTEQFTGLSVFKYARSVFYDNLWNEDPRLLDCRGIVLDSNGSIVSYPFTKVFNYFPNTNMTENGAIIDPQTMVIAPCKVNGFMAACSLYQGDLLISTTGTLDSPHVQLAHQKLNTLDRNALIGLLTTQGGTFTFEICHESDPHIIDETPGAYLIGYRENSLGSKQAREASLNEFAAIIGAKRPACITETFGALIERSKGVKHEGFMVRDFNTEQTLCKIKSPYYLTKKFLMRLHETKVKLLYSNIQSARTKVDEEFYPLLDHIVGTYSYDEFNSMLESDRAVVIDRYFGGVN